MSLEGTTPAIVTPELWEAAQHSLDSNKGHITRNIKIPALLRGHIACGVCGRPMYVCYDSRFHDRIRYRCYTQTNPSIESCGNSWAKGNEVEGFAWAQIAAILKDPDIITRALKEIQQEESNPQLEFDLEATRAGLLRCERAIQRLINRMATADEDDELLFEQELAKQKKEREQYKTLIADLDSRIAVSQKHVADLTSLRDYCEQVRGVIDGFSFEDKRLAVEALRAKVYAVHGQFRLDVPISVQKAIGLEALPEASVVAFQKQTSLILCTRTHGLSRSA